MDKFLANVRSRDLVAAACLGALTIALIGCRPTTKPSVLEITDAGLVTEQETQSRQAINSLTQLYSHSVVYDDSVALNPREISVSPNGILILDLPARIVVLDTLGKFVRHLEWRVGRGPGEITQPVAISWISRAQIAIADRGNRKLVVLDTVGTLLEEYALPRDFVDFGFLPNDQYVTHAGADSSLFRMLELDDSTIVEKTHFGWLTSTRSPLASLSQAGRLIAYRNTDAFMFTPVNAGRLAKYTAYGDQTFYVETIDRTPYYDVELLAADAAKLSSRAPHGVGNSIVSFDNENAYVFRFSIGRAGDGASFIDIYDTNDGQYRESIQMDIADCSPLTIDAVDTWLNCSGLLVRRSVTEASNN